MKKAQVTIFIIIGIILLITLGTAIYLATQIIIKPKTPTTQTPIQSYVQDCIQQTAIIALKKIGDNGGYLSFENPYRNLKLDTNPAEGDALAISEIGLYSIPYWWYMKTPNKCNNCYLTSDNMPLLPEIEEQVNNYVTANLDKCINDFRQFSPEYMITTEEKPIIETFITKENILISSDYPITINKNGQKTKINEFETELTVRFKDIHDLAQEIINLEKNQGIFEERIIHMLSAHMGAAYDKLPPISEITHDYYLITWAKEAVKIRIQQILNSYAPLLRFYGTKNQIDINVQNKYAEGFYNAMQIEDLTKKYNLFVDVSYNNWPFYFSINPNPLTGTYHKQNFPYDILPPFQTNTYEFYYDLSIPLLVQIRDPSAFSGEGYTLNFAIETNIRDNKKPNEWNIGEGTLGLWDSSNVDSEMYTTERKHGECKSTGEEYQCSIDNKKYNTIMQCAEMCYTSEEKTKKPSVLKTEFCSEEQKLSGKIKIKTKSEKNPVPAAGISYKCGNYKTCSIGSTDSDGELETKLPICYGGVLSAHKQGYYSSKKILNTEINKAETIELELTPEKEFTASFKKIPITAVQTKQGIEGRCCEQKTKPLSTQKATLRLEKVKEKPYESEFVQAVMIDEDTSIKLIPGKYTVTMQYLDEIGIVIPAKCKKVCTEETDEMKACRTACDQQEDFVEQNCKIAFASVPDWCEDSDFAMTACKEHCTETKCKKWMRIPEEPLNIRPALLGGAVIDSLNGYWEVTEADLQSGLTHVTFSVLEVPTPTCLDSKGCSYPPCIGLDEMGKTKKYSDKFRAEIEPVFG
ncbi:hypothetical protein GF358_03450 [Candidatus Woesearchaeota archaeon]|nr:hypothetical protein [Candidatus Woesearchaeota archaeon]